MKRLCIVHVGLFVFGLASVGCQSNEVAEAQKKEQEPSHSATQEQRLDELENQWIRVKAGIQGKAGLEQDLIVLRDEIEEEIDSVKRELKKMKESAATKGQEARKAVTSQLDISLKKLEASIAKMREKLG